MSWRKDDYQKVFLVTRRVIQNEEVVIRANDASDIYPGSKDYLETSLEGIELLEEDILEIIPMSSGDD